MHTVHFLSQTKHRSERFLRKQGNGGAVSFQAASCLCEFKQCPNSKQRLLACMTLFYNIMTKKVLGDLLLVFQYLLEYLKLSLGLLKKKNGSRDK